MEYCQRAEGTEKRICMSALPWKGKVMKMKACNGCPDRKLHCHSTCKRHFDEKKALAEEKAMIRKEKSDDKAVWEVLYQDSPDKAKDNLRRRTGKHWKY